MGIKWANFKKKLAHFSELIYLHVGQPQKSWRLSASKTLSPASKTLQTTNLASCKIPESLGGKVIEAVQVASLSGNVLDEIIYKIPMSLAR